MTSVPLEMIIANAKQPRNTFDNIKRLMRSIDEDGLFQDLTVTPDGNGKFLLIDGERRYRALKALGWKEAPIKIKTTLNKPTSALSLIANDQRDDLNHIEQAQCLKRLIEEEKMSQKELADMIHKPESYVSECLKLLTLPKVVQNAVRDGRMKRSTALLLCKAPPEKVEELGNEVVEKNLSVRAVKKRLDEESQQFPPSSEALPKCVHPALAEGNIEFDAFKPDNGLVLRAKKHLDKCIDVLKTDVPEGTKCQLSDTLELLNQAQTLLKGVVS